MTSRMRSYSGVKELPTYLALPNKSLIKGSLISNTNLAGSPSLSTPILHRMGKPTLARKKQQGREI